MNDTEKLDYVKARLPRDILNRYESWKKDNPDDDYQYDEIREFVAGLSRGELLNLFEDLLNITKKIL